MMHASRVARTPGRCNRRRGAAAAEFAMLAVPLAGMLEFGRALMVKQVLTDAARRACRVAIIELETHATVVAQVRNALYNPSDTKGTTLSQAAANNASVYIYRYAGPANNGAWSVATASGAGAPGSGSWSTSSASGGTDWVKNSSRGDAIAVKVTVKIADTGWVYGWFLTGTEIESETIVMLKQ